MTRNRPIGFVDSGIGGLPYLARVRELLPRESLVYYADRQHFPYGSRARDEIRSIVMEAVADLAARADPKLVVVACNTASVVSLAELRRAFSIPFVGVVPAIKPAGAAAPNGRIGVLATERTVEDPYVSRLVEQFAPHSGVALVPASDLVEFVESRIAHAPGREVTDLLRPSADRLRAERVEVVVLGCTHFVYLRSPLEQLLGPSVRVIDSVEGVARQVVRVCDGMGLCAPSGACEDGSAAGPAGTMIVSGGDPGDHYRQIAARFHLRMVLAGTDPETRRS